GAADRSGPITAGARTRKPSSRENGELTSEEGAVPVAASTRAQPLLLPLVHSADAPAAPRANRHTSDTRYKSRSAAPVLLGISRPRERHWRTRAAEMSAPTSSEAARAASAAGSTDPASR